jgi:putative ABC transport system permease protein
MPPTSWLQDVAQDFTVAIRGLRRVPLLTLTIVLTVGIGIGATTVIFSAINAALLQPLPYKDPSRLVWIYTDAPPFMFRFSAVDYLALQEQQTQFERVAGFTDRAMSFSDGVTAELLRGRAVSWTYFGTLGVTPAIGRDFEQVDGRPGSPPAVILSHALWQQRLGARTDILGSRLRLDGAEHTVVGVLPPRTGPLERRQDFFVAVQIGTPPRRGPFPYWMIGRLKPGVDAAAAVSELRAINRRIFPLWKASYQDDKATWSAMDLRERLVGYMQSTAALALVAVALVWLIACVNASNLLVARVTSRRRELGVRAALGASRRRVLRHLLVESAVLAGAAAVIGLAMAVGGVRLLQDAGAAYFPRTEEITIGGPVLWFLVAVTLTSIVLFGAIPAIQGTRASGNEVLRVSERSSTGGRAARQLRRLLVGSQFAIATPLLVIAALLAVSLNQLRQVDVGFDGRHIVSGSIRLPASLYSQPSAAVVFWDELTRRVQAVSGIVRVAFSDSRPPTTADNINNFDLEDFPTPAGQSQPATPFVAVTPEYFDVLDLAVIEGRLLEPVDATRDALGAVVVDQAWSKRFFPNGTALGKRFKGGGCTECPWTTVVGIVGDVKYVGLDQPNQGVVYTPLQPSLTRFLVLRTAGDPNVVLPSVRQVIRELDPHVPLTAVATTDDLVDESLAGARALSSLIVGFALAALLLSLIGIYGVMAYYVQQHAREIGIRLALGGSSRDVLRMVIAQGMTVVAIGTALGLAAAFGSTRMLKGLLFGVSANDLTTFATVAAFLLGVALLACAVPARRAISIEPAAILRGE